MRAYPPVSRRHTTEPLLLVLESPGAPGTPARQAYEPVGVFSTTRLSSWCWSSSAPSRPLAEVPSPSTPCSTLLFRTRAGPLLIPIHSACPLCPPSTGP